MKKEELLVKLDYFIHGCEEKAVNDFYPFYLRLVDESGLASGKKLRCKELIGKLLRESVVHSRILEELKEAVEKRRQDDF